MSAPALAATAANTPIAGIATSATALPGISADWLASVIRPGERYAGIMLAADGSLSHHLFLLPGDADDVDWEQAKAFASTAGGELPTRREQRLLFLNLQVEFQSRAYWSGEQHASSSDCAWYQRFANGSQDYHGEAASLRARAVRRLPIQ